MSDAPSDWTSAVAREVCKLIRDGRVLKRFREQCAKFLDEKERDEEQLAVWKQRRKMHCQKGLQTLAEFKARSEETERLGDDREAMERTRPAGDTDKTWVFDYYVDDLTPDDLARLGSPANGPMLIAFCVWVPPELSLSASPNLTVPPLFGRFTGYLHSPPFGRTIEPSKASVAEKYASLTAIHDARFPDRDPIDELHHINDGRLTKELRRREREYLRQIITELPEAARANVLEWLADVEADLAEHLGPPSQPNRRGDGQGPEIASLESHGKVGPILAPEISRAVIPKVRLFELLIKFRTDQLDRESAWSKAIRARAKTIAKRAKRTLTDAQRELMAKVDAGHLPPTGQDAPDGQWIEGLKEIDEQAYLFYQHRGNLESPACQILAENELKSEDVLEWRRLSGDRFLDGPVWRFRTTPWRFVIGKLHADRAMPFTELQLFEAVRLVQLLEADKVPIEIRRFAVDQDDSGYTHRLLADFRAEYPEDAQTLGFWESGDAQPTGVSGEADEITLAQAAKEFDVPSWAWTRAKQKPQDSPGHLSTKRRGNNVYVRREHARAFAKNFDAHREQRTVGSKSKDGRKIVAALKETRKTSKRSTERNSK